jgi:two-component system phosphate regulon sensor histidine kinase PhoR
MRSISPRSLAWWIASPTSLVFVLIIIFFRLEWLPFEWQIILPATITIFTLCYFISFFLIKSFISLKIAPIYKVIRKTKGTDRLPEAKNNSLNPIEKIYEDVDDWARTKNIEIEELKANARYRQEFLGNVGHELKTPIFNIQGYLLTLLEGGLEDPDINRLYLERAGKSVDRMIHIIKDLEYIGRIEAGELELDYQVFDLVKLVDEIFELHEMRASTVNIKLKFSNKPDRPVLVKADRRRILEVISNLVNNGIAYGKKSGYVSLEILDVEKHVLVELADNGIGIKKEDQQRIFERFYRVDRSRSREQGGTGLGLAIAKHFIEAHGHTINIRSTPGEGTGFTFMLNKG